MKITILTVGKIKEKFFRGADRRVQQEIESLLQAGDHRSGRWKNTGSCRAHEEELIRAKEAERLKKYIKDNAYTIALAIDGKQYSSEDFSAHVHDLGLKGESHLQLIIGGSIGLAPEILSLAQEKISFSKMTFPHQLMRVILLEQIYRAYRIMNGEPYHK